MADTVLAAGEIAAHKKLLAAGVVDKVTFDSDVERVEVISDGVEDLYFRVDKADPAVDGRFAYRLPKGIVSSREVDIPTSGKTEVRLISSGAPTYSVTKVA